MLCFVWTFSHFFWTWAAFFSFQSSGFLDPSTLSTRSGWSSPPSHDPGHRRHGGAGAGPSVGARSILLHFHPGQLSEFFMKLLEASCGLRSAFFVRSAFFGRAVAVRQADWPSFCRAQELGVGPWVGRMRSTPEVKGPSLRLKCRMLREKTRAINSPSK